MGKLARPAIRLRRFMRRSPQGQGHPRSGRRRSGLQSHHPAVQAAHQLSLDVAPGDRLLPLLWALREFKNSQAEDARQGDFSLGPVRGELPSPERAWQELDEAMRAWDEPRADRAIAALARSRGAHEVMEGLWQYGARKAYLTSQCQAGDRARMYQR